VFSYVVGFLAIVLASMNVVGGYAVTDRMLDMFKAKPGERRAAATGSDDGSAA
jgi:NAD(P) transhydrogenase subunit alpha